MSLNSSASASEQWMKNLEVLKKAGPGETPNSQRWFNTMLTYLESKNLAWVVDPNNEDFKETKRLEKAVAGEDEAKKAAVDLRWKKAEAEVKALLLMSVDECEYSLLFSVVLQRLFPLSFPGFFYISLLVC